MPPRAPSGLTSRWRWPPTQPGAAASQGPKLPLLVLPGGPRQQDYLSMKALSYAASASSSLAKSNQVKVPQVTYILCEVSDSQSNRLINKFFKNLV